MFKKTTIVFIILAVMFISTNITPINASEEDLPEITKDDASEE